MPPHPHPPLHRRLVPTAPAAPGSTARLIDGIILACECTFLFKYLLFALIADRLKGEHRRAKQTAFLYTAHHFGAFSQTVRP